MSSGGVFNSVIKSNKSIMIEKSKRFKKTLGGFDNSKTLHFNFKNATPEQLNEIRKKFHRENSRNRFSLTIIIVLIIVILTLVYVFLIHK